MQKKVIVALILYVIMMSIGLGVVSSITINDTVERSLKKNLTSAHTIANQLDFLLQTNINRLYDISLSGKVDLDTHSWAPIKRLLESIYQYSIFTEGVFLLDRLGNTLLSYPARDYRKENLLFIPWVSRVLADGKPVISNIYTIEPIKKPLIFVLVPLRNQIGEIIGVAGGAVNPTNSVMSRLLFAVTQEPEEHFLEIIDSNEIVVSADKSSRILMHHDHGGSLGEMIKKGQEGIRICNHDYSQAGSDGSTHNLIAVVPLQTVSWAVIFGQTKDKAFLPVEHLRNNFSLLALFFIGTAIIFSLGISKNIVSPIRSLIAATNRIGQGDLSSPVGNIGSDEIAVLSNSFDGMREQLAKSLESIRLHNIELEERVKRRTRQLEEKQRANTTLLKQLITSQDDERKRIARELHDESLQMLSAILMNIDMCRLHPEAISAEKIGMMREMVMKVLNEMARIIQNLRPTVLDDLGLEAAIVWLADKNLRDKQIRYSLDMNDLSDERLSPELQLTLFRIIQETTMNIAKHAEAKNVSININVHNNRLTVFIEDDGVGFDTASALEDLQSGRGLGILGMRERAAQVSGTLHVWSAVNAGTIVQCSIPLTKEE